MNDRELLWKILLKVNTFLKNNRIDSLVIDESLEINNDNQKYNPLIVIDFLQQTAQGDALHIQCLEPFSIQTRSPFPENHLGIIFLELYLPYAVLPYFSFSQEKTFFISHFAQSVNGKISLRGKGQMKIGNHENFVHSHRMRALCDGIMVGYKTLLSDNPELNVRLVEGTSPTKIILGGKRLEKGKHKAVCDKTIHIIEKEEKKSHLKVQEIYINEPRPFNLHRVSQILHEKGFASVYLEGGAYTTTEFLKQDCLNQVQIHISPQIFSSGKIGFKALKKKNEKEVFEFKSHRFFPIGNHIMLVGNV